MAGHICLCGLEEKGGESTGDGEGTNTVEGSAGSRDGSVTTLSAATTFAAAAAALTAALATTLATALATAAATAAAATARCGRGTDGNPGTR